MSSMTSKDLWRKKTSLPALARVTCRLGKRSQLISAGWSARHVMEPLLQLGTSKADCLLQWVNQPYNDWELNHTMDEDSWQVQLLIWGLRMYVKLTNKLLERKVFLGDFLEDYFGSRPKNDFLLFYLIGRPKKWLSFACEHHKHREKKKEEWRGKEESGSYQNSSHAGSDTAAPTGCGAHVQCMGTASLGLHASYSDIIRTRNRRELSFIGLREGVGDKGDGREFSKSTFSS